jgi:peptidoglycan/xylan/chitin deacetylase (PgdA/CDA1 family)
MPPLTCPDSHYDERMEIRPHLGGRKRSGISRLDHLAFWRPALRVLSYHHVRPAHSDRFAVSTEQLDRQLRYLTSAGFNFIHARDLLAQDALPKRPILLTFDDGYVDNLEDAQPILRAHHAKATIFVVTGYAGDHARWNSAGAPLMCPRQLHQLDPEVFELALHSHWHRSFEAMQLDEIEQGLRENLEFFRKHNLAVTPALAYPYGARPKLPFAALSARLGSLGIRLAFRIGNRLTRLPISNPYEIQRIDVRGDASHAVFRQKLWLGKLI